MVVFHWLLRSDRVLQPELPQLHEEIHKHWLRIPIIDLIETALKPQLKTSGCFQICCWSYSRYTSEFIDLLIYQLLIHQDAK